MKKVFPLITAMLLHLHVQADTWNGSASDKTWYDETKTEFHIYNAAQLRGVADLVNDGTSTFKETTIYLENDIDLGNHPWIPIGYGNYNPNFFCGTFNGNDHSITNLYISTNKLTGTYFGTGLFGNTENSSFLNLHIQGRIEHDSTHGLGSYLGGLVGDCRNGKIENIRSKIDISIISDGSWGLGGDNCDYGFVAGCATTISKVYSEGTLSFTNCGTASAFWGGIAGRAGNIEECYSNTQMIIPHDASYGNPPSVGGIAGYVDYSVKNSIFTGSISVNYYGGKNCFTGGICGMGERGIKIENVIAAPSYFYSYAQASATCLINRSATPVVQNAYYANTYAGSYETYGTAVSEDYLKSGAVLNGFDTNIWEFKAGKYPRLKSLIPTYAINAPTEHGSIAYCVTEGGEAKIKINSYQDWEIDKVFVNQMDVTSQMNGSMLIFEDIQENKDLFVVYKQTPSNVRSLQQNASFDISKTAEGFQVSGVQLGKTIAVYDLNGMELVRQSSNGKNLFALPKGLYIISACGQSKKVSF